MLAMLAVRRYASYDTLPYAKPNRTGPPTRRLAHAFAICDSWAKRTETNRRKTNISNFSKLRSGVSGGTKTDHL